jgi:peptidoglycan/xylan/chitin deacetylase (PgdA/CDA1 family)
MLALKDLKDFILPDKALCLTYDDGPGPDTLEIARFLHQHKIRATFFVVGKFAIEQPQILDELHAMGHIIGNHTYEHPDMPYFVSINGNVQDQVIRTNALIHKYNEGKLTYFRAPYGKWSPEVAHELNANIRTSYKFAGPIYWDIEGIDCYYWKLGRSVEDTVNIYLEKIHLYNKGVVVMHDQIADMDTVKAVNKTLDLTKKLIPILIEQGYSFVGLDEIKDPQLDSAKDDVFALQAPNGNFLQYEDKEGGLLKWTDKGIGAENITFTIEGQDYGKICLKTRSGLFLSVNADINPVVRVTETLNEYALLDDIPVDNSNMQFRTYNGNYWGANYKSQQLLKADANFMHQALTVKYFPLKMAYNKPFTFKEQVSIFKKRFKFIKSKVLQS